MKVAMFAVSIQYGGGHHYFLRTDLETEAEAIKLQKEREELALAHWKRTRRGAKPKAHTWGHIT